MAKTDAERMRSLLEQMHSHDVQSLEENMLTRGIGKMGNLAANWLSKKFGNVGLDFRSLAQYQTPATVKMFQNWMRQYRQKYDTVTWNTLNDFFVRNAQLRKIEFNDDISGRPLTKAELGQVIADDRQVLAKIVGSKYLPLLPKTAAELNTKVTNKEPIAPGDADGAYAIVVAVIEAALVHMFILAQPEQAGEEEAPAASAAKPAAQQPPAAKPGVPAVPAAQPAAPGAVGMTAAELDTLKKLLGITS